MRRYGKATLFETIFTLTHVIDIRPEINTPNYYEFLWYYTIV